MSCPHSVWSTNGLNECLRMNVLLRHVVNQKTYPRVRRGKGILQVSLLKINRNDPEYEGKSEKFRKNESGIDLN